MTVPVGGSADRTALVEDDGTSLMWIPRSSPRMTVQDDKQAALPKQCDFFAPMPQQLS